MFADIINNELIIINLLAIVSVSVVKMVWYPDIDIDIDI